MVKVAKISFFHCWWMTSKALRIKSSKRGATHPEPYQCSRFLLCPSSSISFIAISLQSCNSVFGRFPLHDPEGYLVFRLLYGFADRLLRRSVGNAAFDVLYMLEGLCKESIGIDIRNQYNFLAVLSAEAVLVFKVSSVRL